VFILITKALFLSFAGKTSGGDGLLLLLYHSAGKNAMRGQNSPQNAVNLQKKLQIFLEKGRFSIDSLVIIEV